MPPKRRKLVQRKEGQKQNRKDSDLSIEKYEIERIDNHRINHYKKSIEFLVKWKGYNNDSSTWEEFEMFAYDAPEVAQEYLIQILQRRDQIEELEEKKNVNEDIEEGKGEERQGLNRQQIKLNADVPIKIIYHFEYTYQQTQKMGFLIEIAQQEQQNQNQYEIHRQLISEEELLLTHSKEMYYFLKTQIKFKKKITVPMKDLKKPNFEEKLSNLLQHSNQNEEEQNKLNPNNNMPFQ